MASEGVLPFLAIRPSGRPKVLRFIAQANESHDRTREFARHTSANRFGRQRDWSTVMTAHGRRRYREGCRCDECKAAEAAYKRRYRERKLLGDIAPAAEVGQQKASADRPDPGPVEAGVIEAIGGELAQLRPDLYAVAVSLAQLMDDPRAKSQRAACAGKLREILRDLRVSVAKPGGKLAAVQAMTRPTGA
jgi:hypothetical protein